MAIVKYGTGVTAKKTVAPKNNRKKPTSELANASKRYEQRMQKIVVEERTCWAELQMHQY